MDVRQLCAVIIVGTLMNVEGGYSSSEHDINFKICDKSGDTSRLVLHKISAWPWPVKDGDSIHVRLTLDLKERIERGGRYSILVQLSGFNLWEDQGDLCDISPDLTCPYIPKNNMQIVYSKKLPKLPLEGDVTITIKLTDQTQHEILCTKFDVKVDLEEMPSNFWSLDQLRRPAMKIHVPVLQ